MQASALSMNGCKRLRLVIGIMIMAPQQKRMISFFSPRRLRPKPVRLFCYLLSGSSYSRYAGGRLRSYPACFLHIPKEFFSLGFSHPETTPKKIIVHISAYMAGPKKECRDG